MEDKEGKDASDLELCPVCQDEIKIYAVGKCDHPICFKCSIRMRLLCEQFHCPICRSEIRQIAMLTSKVSFESINFSALCMDGKNKIFSESTEIQDQYRDLMRHVCTMCETPQEFKSFSQLRYHVSRVHKLMSCKLCTDNLKLFSSERKFYNTQEIVRHKKIGDADEKSYRGHPLCQFCDERYFDKDTLNLHLRKDHYYCQFCEKNGLTGEFYCTYEDLKKHFKEEHILCEEGECAKAQWTHAFDCQIDYRAHVVKSHKELLNKPEFKKFMHLNIALGHEEHRDRKRNYQQRREPQGNSEISSAIANVVRQGYVNVAPQAVIDLIRGRTTSIAPTQDVPQLSTNVFPTTRPSGSGGATGGNIQVATPTAQNKSTACSNATARSGPQITTNRMGDLSASAGNMMYGQDREIGNHTKLVVQNREAPQLLASDFPSIRASSSGIGGGKTEKKTTLAVQNIKTFKEATAVRGAQVIVNSRNEISALASKKKNIKDNENQTVLRATKTESENYSPDVTRDSKERFQPHVERQLEKLGPEDKENHFDSKDVQSNTVEDRQSSLAKPMKKHTYIENTSRKDIESVTEEFPNLPIKKPLNPSKQAKNDWSSGSIVKKISDSPKTRKVQNPQKTVSQTDSSIQNFPSLPVHKPSKAVPTKQTNVAWGAESGATKIAKKKEKLTKPLIQMLPKTSNQEIHIKPVVQNTPKASDHEYPSILSKNMPKTEPCQNVSGWEDSTACKIMKKKKNNPRPEPQKPQNKKLDQEFPSLPFRIAEERILKVAKVTKAASEQDLEAPMERMSKLIIAEKSRSTLESLKKLLNNMNNSIVEAEEFYVSCAELLTPTFFEDNFRDISACVTSSKDRAKVTALYQLYCC